jgi:hypothetical protein
VNHIAEAKLAFASTIGFALGIHALFGATPAPAPTPPPIDLTCDTPPPPQNNVSGLVQMPYVVDSKHPPAREHLVPYDLNKDKGSDSPTGYQGVYPTAPPSKCPTLGGTPLHWRNAPSGRTG